VCVCVCARSLAHLVYLHERKNILTNEKECKEGNMACVFVLRQWVISTGKPRFTNASDHEQFGLRTNFPNTKRLG